MASKYKRKGSRFWWVKYRDFDGGQVRKSLRTADKRVAELLRKKYDIIESGSELRKTDLKSLVNEWASHTALTASPRQARDNRTHLNAFLDWGSITEPEHLSRAALQGWVLYLSQTYAPKTVKNKLASVTGFCRYLVRHDIIDKAPMVEAPKIVRKPPRFLTLPQTRAVLDFAFQSDERLFMAVLLALKTGCRMNEIRTMSWEHFDWESGTILIPHTKSNWPRSVPIHRDVRAQLEPVARGTGPLFPSPRQTYYDKWWFLRLIEPIQTKFSAWFTDDWRGKRTGRGWHLFRHTFAVQYMREGGNIYDLSHLLGHANINTTVRLYAHFAPKSEQIQAAIDRV